DGHIINARLSVGLIRDDDGGPRYFVSQIYDTTVEKRQAEVLHGYQARFELALETARAAYWELDLASQIYSSGAEYFALLGYGREQATQDKQSWLVLVHPEDRKQIAQAH